MLHLRVKPFNLTAKDWSAEVCGPSIHWNDSYPALISYKLRRQLPCTSVTGTSLIRIGSPVSGDFLAVEEQCAE